MHLHLGPGVTASLFIRQQLQPMLSQLHRIVQSYSAPILEAKDFLGGQALWEGTIDGADLGRRHLRDAQRAAELIAPACTWLFAFTACRSSPR